MDGGGFDGLIHEFYGRFWVGKALCSASLARELRKSELSCDYHRNWSGCSLPLRFYLSSQARRFLPDSGSEKGKGSKKSFISF